MRFKTPMTLALAAAAGLAHAQAPVSCCGVDCSERAVDLDAAARPLDRWASTHVSGARGSGSLEDGSQIDLLVVYTTQAAAANGGAAGIETRIDAGVAELNLVLSNSLVLTEFMLVGTQEVTVSETSLGTMLNWLRQPNDGVLDEVHDLRDQTMADLVMLITSSGDVCGIANIGVGPGNTPTPQNAFSVVSAPCILAPTSAFAHEIGHNMGLLHDWDAQPCTNGGSRFGKGYAEPSGSFMTIMGTSNPAPRVLHFSNPDVDYNGLPTGEAIGEAQASDSASALMLAAPIVAKYRDRDCNANGVLDSQEIAGGILADCNGNGIADLCEQDFNRNGEPDDCDISSGTSLDADANGVPDEVEVPVLKVDQGATGAGTGTSWGDAMTSLQDALSLARASSAVQEIWIAGGTYRPGVDGQRDRSFELVSGVSLRGGFSGFETSPDERDSSASPTYLSGDLNADDSTDPATKADNAINVVFSYSQPDPITLDRLVIEGGYADFEVNCGAFMFDGGGLCIFNTNIEVVDCEVRNNAALRGGGAAILSLSPARVYNSWFHDNQAIAGTAWTANGPAVWSGSSAGLFFNSNVSDPPNEFINNRVEFNESMGEVSGMFAIGGRSIIANSVFAHNTMQTLYGGGGLRVQLTDGTEITNCTIADNTAPNTYNSYTSGLYLYRTTAVMNNNIIWGNSTTSSQGQTAQFSVAGTTDPNPLDNSIVQGWTGSLAGAGTSSADPMFADAANGDYSLLAGSSAIDMGDNDALPADVMDLDGDGDTGEALPIDLAGAERRVDDPDTADTGVGAAPIVDAGAYEYQPEVTCQADVNGDGLLDFFDVSTFLAQFSAHNPAADLNGDGHFDFFDVSIFLNLFSSGCP